MRRVLNLCRSGYYAWCDSPGSSRVKENQILFEQIVEIFEASRVTYESPRIHAALLAQGFDVDFNRVACLMSELDVRAHPKRKFKATNDSEHRFLIEKNVLDRVSETTEPDRIWVVDMTYMYLKTK